MTVAYAVMVLVISVVPVDPRVSVGHLDKVWHLGEYLLFAWLLVHALRTTAPPAGWEPVYPWWVWIVATSYGLLIECLQALLPWRSAELGDALANTVGAALGVWLGMVR